MLPLFCRVMGADPNGIERPLGDDQEIGVEAIYSLDGVPLPCGTGAGTRRKWGCGT